MVKRLFNIYTLQKEIQIFFISRFISNQVGPMHEMIGPDVNIKFVPYGFADVCYLFIHVILHKCHFTIVRQLKWMVATSLNVNMGLMNVMVTWFKPAPLLTLPTMTLLLGNKYVIFNLVYAGDC